MPVIFNMAVDGDGGVGCPGGYEVTTVRDGAPYSRAILNFSTRTGDAGVCVACVRLHLFWNTSGEKLLRSSAVVYDI